MAFVRIGPNHRVDMVIKGIERFRGMVIELHAFGCVTETKDDELGCGVSTVDVSGVHLGPVCKGVA